MKACTSFARTATRSTAFPPHDWVKSLNAENATGSCSTPGLHLLERSCDGPLSDLTTSGVTLTSIRQETILLASVPLTDEAWQPLRKGEVTVVMNGEVVARTPGNGQEANHSKSIAGDWR